MAHRPYLMWPDKGLREKARPVEAITDEIRAIWDEMIEAMDTMPGVGLAAPQLGIPLALAVVDASTQRGQAVRMANPKVLHASVEPRVHEEGPPNLPGVWAKVTRPRAVTVAYTDETGARVEKDFVGLWATSVQHQIDHLDGKMFFDRLSRVKRDAILRKAKKAGRG